MPKGYLRLEQETRKRAVKHLVYLKYACNSLLNEIFQNSMLEIVAIIPLAVFFKASFKVSRESNGVAAVAILLGIHFVGNSFLSW